MQCNTVTSILYVKFAITLKNLDSFFYHSITWYLFKTFSIATFNGLTDFYFFFINYVAQLI